VEALVRAQARLDHSRHGAALKQAARDAAAARKREFEEQMQVCSLHRAACSMATACASSVLCLSCSREVLDACACTSLPVRLPCTAIDPALTHKSVP
jgi:hypothetical protein